MTTTTATTNTMQLSNVALFVYSLLKKKKQKFFYKNVHRIWNGSESLVYTLNLSPFSSFVRYFGA